MQCRLTNKLIITIHKSPLWLEGKSINVHYTLWRAMFIAEKKPGANKPHKFHS